MGDPILTALGLCPLPAGGHVRGTGESDEAETSAGGNVGSRKDDPGARGKGRDALPLGG